MRLQNLFIAPKQKQAKMAAAVFNFLLACALVVVIFWLSLGKVGVKFDFAFIGQMQGRILSGFWMTVKLSLVSLILSLILGILCAVGQGSRVLFLRSLCSLYVQFIRGTPLIMQIYLFYYILGTAWHIDGRFWAGALILSVFEGAYIAEIIRGSLLSLSSSQKEAAKAVGFTSAQSVRYIILPQLIERTLPALAGQFASIIKDSSLLSMIAVIELTQTMREISATYFNLFESYIFLGFLYLCLTLPISLLSKAMERRFRYED